MVKVCGMVCVAKAKMRGVGKGRSYGSSRDRDGH